MLRVIRPRDLIYQTAHRWARVSNVSRQRCDLNLGEARTHLPYVFLTSCFTKSPKTVTISQTSFAEPLLGPEGCPAERLAPGNESGNRLAVPSQGIFGNKTRGKCGWKDIITKI